MDSSALPAFAAACGVIAAAALARVGSRHAGYRGWPLWVAAELLGAVALAVAIRFPAAPVLQAWACLALLAWPILVLLGLRRFHARLGLPASSSGDVAVYLGCALLTLMPVLAPSAAVGPVLLPGVATLVLHLYVATVMGSSRLVEDVAALRLLGAVVALAALLPGAMWFAGAPWTMRLPASGLALLVVAFVLLTLVGERTERELRSSRRRLHALAHTDGLTNVPNRRRFQELAQRMFEQPEPEAELPVLVLFDVDHFKLINDKFGHAAGDRALRLVGQCMQEALRAHDVAGRLGGDEFALLLAGTTLKQAMGVADRIATQLQLLAPQHRLPTLGLSFGLVQVPPGEGIDEALRRADQALYEAKRQGRSCAVTAEGDEARPVFSESRRLGLTAA